MRFVHSLFTIFIILILALGGLGLYTVNMVTKPSALSEDRLIEVPRGWGMNRLAHYLEDEGIIESALMMKLWARATAQGAELKSGEFMIASGSSMLSVLEEFTEGVAHQRQVTVPEGATSYEIVQILNAEANLTGDVILNIPPEGSLLPETYNYTKAETRADIISRMTNAQKQVLDKLWPTRAENLPFETREEALILASIIEKETGIGGERARIAGVFVNRLRIGMPLQTDPTVIYALTLGKHQNDGQGPLGRRLLSKDLKVDSPYNTYRYKGLPPTPIANAGRAAIAAALNPETHKYLYFVADGTGGHAFSKTLAEHNANAAKWRKIRKAQGN
ncbi:MAG: aminodeoxychorismate lyase [Alphaproteobacteria bacterium]|nr:aminodeoxychorismate lyase [Alphaproteobacteria bacterium]